ncbi:MAG: response regulator [Geobacter sp.]|nr:response regulator [Geobacter sp.]
MPLRVLIIDKNRSLCSMLSGILQDHGHEATCAHTGKDGLETADRLRPDLVILDLVMPDMAGMDVIRYLERQDETRDIPIIVVSADLEMEDELLGVFDFIPKPVAINRLLEDLALVREGRGRRRRLGKGVELSSAEFGLFHDYILERCGLHFEPRNAKLLQRGLVNRMGALKISSFREYYDYLVQHAERRGELNKLLQFLTVGETYFFRYHAHYEILREQVIGDATEERRKDGTRRLRLWSAGCSTGEEPYSLAITVMESLPDWRDWDIQILATDINRRSLKRARDGVYSHRALRVTPGEYLGRYFEKVGTSFIVKDEVRSLVEFAQFNLQTPVFPGMGDPTGGFDAIFCRNVMIYFNVQTMREIVKKFTRSLVPAGYLFLGHSETLMQISSDYERLSRHGGFYYRKKDGVAVAASPREGSGRLPEAAAPVAAGKPSPFKRRREPPRVPELPAFLPVPLPPASASPEVLFRQAEKLFDDEHYEAASEVLEEVLAAVPDHTGACVMQGFILANSGRFEEALACCERALRLDDLLPQAYFLKGLIMELIDRETEAVKEYRKAILLDMFFVMPHYHLGKLFVRTGKHREGLRELKNCRKILAGSPESSIVPHSGGLSREVFMEILRGELAELGY